MFRANKSALSGCLIRAWKVRIGTDFALMSKNEVPYEFELWNCGDKKIRGIKKCQKRINHRTQISKRERQNILPKVTKIKASRQRKQKAGPTQPLIKRVAAVKRAVPGAVKPNRTSRQKRRQKRRKQVVIHPMS